MNQQKGSTLSIYPGISLWVKHKHALNRMYDTLSNYKPKSNFNRK